MKTNKHMYKEMLKQVIKMVKEKRKIDKEEKWRKVSPWEIDILSAVYVTVYEFEELPKYYGKTGRLRSLKLALDVLDEKTLENKLCFPSNQYGYGLETVANLVLHFQLLKDAIKYFKVTPIADVFVDCGVRPFSEEGDSWDQFVNGNKPKRRRKNGCKKSKIK